jgi:hypothetical protein
MPTRSSDVVRRQHHQLNRRHAGNFCRYHHYVFDMMFLSPLTTMTMVKMIAVVAGKADDEAGGGVDDGDVETLQVAVRSSIKPAALRTVVFSPSSTISALFLYSSSVVVKNYRQVCCCCCCCCCCIQ